MSGACNYTGPTLINAGTLKITSSLSGTSSLTVAEGSTLFLNGGIVSVAGPIINNGVIRLSGAGALSTTGSFTNSGVLDLINGTQTLPANFINNGKIIDTSAVAVESVDINADGSCSIVLPGFAGHTYQLVSKASMTDLTWQNVGNSQSVSNSQVGSVPVTLTDTAATGSAKFYRVVVTASP